jgi:endonuclease-3 related protein
MTKASHPLENVYQRLYQAYGPQVGAILTQSTSWTGVERAIDALKTEGILSPAGLRDVHQERLASLIHPSGYFNAKAQKLKAFVNHLWDHYGGELVDLLRQEINALRRELLSIHGIGPETADDIILYAADKPIFVIDAYTRRILNRLVLAPEESTYEAYQQLFHQALPPNAALFNEYHALLVRHGKDICRKRPLCFGCCLLETCPTGTAQPSSEPS